MLRHVLDMPRAVENHQKRAVGRKHDGVKNRILLNTARDVGNHEQVTNTAVIFYEKLEEYLPPKVLPLRVPHLHERLSLAVVELAAHSDLVRKLLELFRRYELPQYIALDIVGIGEELHHIAARLKDIKRIIRKDKRKVRARKQRIEQRTRTHAVLEVFLDIAFEKYSGDKSRKRHEDNHRKDKRELDSLETFVELGNHGILVQNTNKVIGILRHRRRHEHETLAVVGRLFQTDDIPVPVH